MSDTWPKLGEQYVHALQDYLVGAGEAALKRAYELGRQAIDNRLGVLDMAAAHHAALATLLAQARPPGDSARVAQQAGIFFAESLSPFEMTQRGFQEAIVKLHDLNETLEQRVAEQTRELRDTNQTLQTLIHASPLAIVVLDPAENVRLWNPAAEHIFGWRTAEVLGRPNPLLPDDGPKSLHPLREVALTGQSFANLEIYCRTHRDALIPVSLSAAPLYDAQGNISGLMGILADITERKQAEQAQRLLAEASRLLATSLDYATTLTSVAQLVVPQMADWCAVDVVEEDQSVRPLAVAHVNPTKVERARELQQRFPPDPNAASGVPNVLRTGQPEIYPEIPKALLEAGAQDAEHRRLLRELGSKSVMIVPLLARGRTLGAITFVWAESGRRYGPADLALAEELARRAALAMDNARLYREAQRLNAELEQRVIARTAELLAANVKLEAEIAERKLAEEQLRRSQEQLRALSAYLESVREQERTRIAREIHDELGQTLTSLKMDLAWLQDHLGDENSAALLKKMESMSGLIDATGQTVHRISAELRPGVLDDLGLADAIEWQLQEFQARTGVACNLTSEVEEVELDPEESTAIFRIFQETLTNVARHANATRVNVSLEAKADHLILRVQDDGRGITEEEISNSRSFGLMGIRERALLLAGEVEIRGGPGQGTTVTLRIPLNHTK